MTDVINQPDARQGSLLSLGEALRAAQPVQGKSRLADALAKVRQEQTFVRDMVAERTAADSSRLSRRQVGGKADASLEPAPEAASAVEPAPPAESLQADLEPAISRAHVATGTDPRLGAEPPSSVGVPSDDRFASPMGWRPLIDPSKVVGGVSRSKTLIAATTIAGAILGVLVALNTPKTYEAGAELLADPRDLNLVDKELTQSGISNEATLAIVDNQVRILTSGGVLTKVADRLNLAQDAEFNGQGTGGGLIGSIRSAFFAADKDAEPGRRQALAIMALSKALSVERSGKTFIIVVRATTQSPEKSALIANTMADVFLESSGDLQSDAAGRAAGELTGKLDELRKGVETAERKVETFKAENDLIDAQGRLITDDEILKLNEQLSIARARTLELNARAVSTRSVNVDSVLNGAIPEELASPGMQELRSQYSTLKGEADRVAVRLGPKHPSFMAVEAQLDGARQLIDTEIRRIVSSSQTEMKRAVQLEQELSSRLAQLKIRQGSLSNQLVTLREMEREATAKRAVYESFLLRARETGEQQGINSANISVISKAYPPLEASGASRSAIAIAGTVLGFLAGIGLGGARGTFDSLRATARGGEETRAARPVRRRRKATMFDSPDEPATAARPGPTPTAPPHEPEPPAARQAAFPERQAHAQAAPTPSSSAVMASSPDPAPAAPRRAPAVSEIDDIRAGLRECRDAIRELAESRSNRRYF